MRDRKWLCSRHIVDKNADGQVTHYKHRVSPHAFVSRLNDKAILAYIRKTKRSSFLRCGDEWDEIVRMSNAERETRVLVFVHPDFFGFVGAGSGLASCVARDQVPARHAV